ncbi:unnamed protein product [Amoebophrya sp. A120]|nr:unnamed protein product [Amoebophrya sp. A120]|eukprot:GSA120T00021679001.1
MPKTERSAAGATSAKTSAMRTGTTTQQNNEKNQVKGTKFKMQKVAPSGIGQAVDRSVEPDHPMLEKISSFPTLCTMLVIFLAPISFFGIQGNSELGDCADTLASCNTVCTEQHRQALTLLRGAEKFAIQAAADAELATCTAACEEVNSQCNFEAMLKIVACLGLVGIVVCVAARANVNFFVEQNIKNMERDIAEEAAEMARKAQKEQKKSVTGSPEKKKAGSKALFDEDAGPDDDAKSHHSGSSKGTGVVNKSETKATSSAGRSEDSSALSANVIKGSGLEEIITSSVIPRNPYIVKTFTGSRNQKTRCPYCLTEFYNVVSHDLVQGTLSSSPVVCIGCNEVISGFV